MNKYSKRALKTTATVGMSLAMVLSGVAAPLVKVDAAVPACSVEVTNNAKNLLYAIKTDLGDIKLKNLSIDEEVDGIDWAETKETIDTIKGSGTITLADNKLETLLGTEVETGVKVLDYITAYVDCDGGNADAITLAGKDDQDPRTMLDKVAALDEALGYLDTTFEEGSVTFKEKTEYDTARGHYDTIVALYDTFKGNIAKLTKTTNQGYYDLYFADLKDAVDEYEESFVGDFSDKYVEVLKIAEIYKDGLTVDEVVNSSKPFLYTDLTKLEDFIKDLKEDKVTFKDAAGIEVSVVSYKTVADEADVEDLVGGLEAVVEDLKEVKELLKTTNKTIKNYRGISTIVGTLAEKAEAYDDNDGETVDAYDDAINAFRSDEITKLVAYVEEIAEEFYTVETVKRTSGNYTLRLKGTDFARYVTKGSVISEDLETILTTNILKDEEESVYNALSENQSDTDKLMAAITAIEDIKIGTTFTTAEANKIVAAKKAYTAMTDANGAINASYNTALTTKEKRTVKANADLINALYIKLMLTGTITESGWINTGNGNWDYINADGSKSTKWVAAGKDWYFVQNGTMLRSAWVAQDSTGAKWYYVDNAGKMVSNTTIDGFVIDANGVWTK